MEEQKSKQPKPRRRSKHALQSKMSDDAVSDEVAFEQIVRRYSEGTKHAVKVQQMLKSPIGKIYRSLHSLC